MNVLETNLVLGTLQSAFPSFYRGLSQKNATDIADLWRKMFEDDDFKAVMAAVQALIATRTESFPPTIGEVKEKLGKLKNPNDISEQEAWAMVSKACQNGYYHSKEEFEKLPEVVQRSIGNPDQLKVWAQMDSSTVESVVASNFMRTFKVKKQQQKELDMMPTEVKQYMAAVADKMQMTDGREARRLEEPKQAALPPKLEPMIRMEPVKRMEQREEPSIPKPGTAYKPLSEEEFEKRREELLQKMQGIQKAVEQ